VVGAVRIVGFRNWDSGPLGAYGVLSWLMLPAPVMVESTLARVESVRDGRTSAAVRYGFVCHFELWRFRGAGLLWIWRERWWGQQRWGTEGVEPGELAYREVCVLANSDSRCKGEIIADFELTRRRGSYFRVRVRTAVRSLKHVGGRGMTLRGIWPPSSYAGHHPRDRDRRKPT